LEPEKSGHAYLGVDVLQINRKTDLSTIPTSVAPIPNVLVHDPVAYVPSAISRSARP
jgi:hypothetical protein